MKFSLASLVRMASNPRRSAIPIRDIAPPAMLAANLYARCYRPIINRWTAAVPQLIVEYERSMPINDGFRDSISDLGLLLDSLGEELRRLIIELVPELQDWTVRTSKWWDGKWRGNVLTATGVDLSTILMAGGTPTSVQTTIAWNVALMKDVSAVSQQKISSAVFAAFQARLPARDLARQIREVIGASRQRSLRIAGDQLSKLSVALETERMSDAGISQFKYRHGLKKHPRPWHAARNGKVYDLATLKEIGGDDVIKADDAPGLPPGCSCRKQALLTLD